MVNSAASNPAGAEDASPADVPLPDGAYDVFVVDAHHVPEAPTRVTVELTLLDGEHKGEVLSLGCPTAELLPDDGDPIDLLGETGVLAVVDGTPGFQIDR